MSKLSALVLVLCVLLLNLKVVSAFEFPSSSGLFNNFPFPSIAPFPFPSKTPKPSSTPDPTATPKPTPTPSNIFEIADIDPSSANFMQEFVVYGGSFGTTAGSINFRASGQSFISAGAAIISWNNNEIHAKVPAVKKGAYYIQVVTSDNRKTKEERFSVKNGQPIIVSTSLQVVNSAYELTFQGTEFGGRGSIDIYNGSSLVGHGILKSWSTSRIRFAVPALPHQEYGFQITTADGRQSSLRMFTVGN